MPVDFAQMPRRAGDSPMMLKSTAAAKQAAFACAGDLAERTRPASSSVKRFPKSPTANLLAAKEASTDHAWTFRVSISAQKRSDDEDSRSLIEFFEF